MESKPFIGKSELGSYRRTDSRIISPILRYMRYTKTPCEFVDVTAKVSVSSCYAPINGLLWDEVRLAGQPTGIS